MALINEFEAAIVKLVDERIVAAINDDGALVPFVRGSVSDISLDVIRGEIDKKIGDLDDRINGAVEEQLENKDIDRMVEYAVDNMDLEDKVNDALESVDLQGKIDEAVESMDIRCMVKDALQEAVSDIKGEFAELVRQEVEKEIKQAFEAILSTLAGLVRG